ncbi:hypothetical protein EV182_005306 [Spiromyces aspiralis]|uniref:Uncharacterized protein n=1 Tax=Spiromyces aspiralis TaxID=68401 RepID=A0ACC1HAS7_9FUNG|nr:hypothetical protein EV182_005306 [Spiromyces aspiralis]
MFPIYMLLKKPTSSLGYATVLMPSFGGLFNFLVFLMQPTLDPLRTVFFRTGLLRKVNAWRHPSSSQQFLTIDGNDDGPVQTAAATDKHNSGTISSILNHGHDHQQPPSLSLLASPQQHQSQPNHVTVQFNSHRANPEIFYSSQYRDYQPVYDYSLNSQMPPPYKAL